MKRKIYDLYDLDGNALMRGNAAKIGDHLGCEEHTVRDYASRGLVLRRKYRIKPTGEFEVIVRKKKVVEPEIDYSTNPYECMKWHLRVYGDTFVTFNPESYIPRLKEEGIECTYRMVRDYIESARPKKRGRKPKPKYFYVVEVVNAERGSRSI